MKMQKTATTAVVKTSDLQEARVSVVSVRSPGGLQEIVVNVVVVVAIVVVVFVVVVIRCRYTA